MEAGILPGMQPLPIGLAQAGKPFRFSNEEYASRRRRLMERIGDGIAVFLGAVEPDGDSAFRQGKDFMYLTGVSIPNACLIVDGLRRESTLFFTMDEAEADGQGIPLEFVRNPSAAIGVEKALPFDRFGPVLSGLLHRARTVYTMFRPEELGPQNSNEKFNSNQKTMTLNAWDGRLTRELQFVKHLRERFPQADVHDVSPIVWDLRKFKSPAEIEVLRRAGRIGVEAHKAVIRAAKPGVSEKPLAAVFEFVCKASGAKSLAYETIIMSGKNHAYGHYHQYDRILSDGDFIILDAGPDVDEYRVDVSTTFPAGKAFTQRQAELYTIALEVHDVCMANYRPGITLGRVGEKVEVHLRERGHAEYIEDFAGVIRYGGYNHSVGMATHDVMGSFAGPDEILQPGFVFACDIQLFRLKEEIGIRIEDTVAIAENGCDNLSIGAPRTVAEIEQLKLERSLLDSLV